MRIPRMTQRLLILPVCLIAGCATTSRVSPKIRTVASVGDRPLPIVSGEPGDSVTADRGLPAPRTDPDGRLSGRVYDAEGEPVPNARVRLAVSGAPGGKVVRATTDRSGAFTLRGLRPGSRYTVIAEWEDGQQVFTGRSEAKAPEADVRIGLRPQEAEAEGSEAAPRGSSARVSTVSERDEGEGEEADDEPVRPARRSAAKVNEEDLPPAPEAEALSSRRSAGRPAPADGQAEEDAVAEAEMPRTARWQRIGSPRGEGDDPEPTSAPGGREAAPSTPADDDGPNPLPPALENGQAFRSPRGQAAPAADEDPFAEDPVATGRGGPPPAGPVASGRGGRRAAPGRGRDEETPGELVVVPETYTPINLAEADPRPRFRYPSASSSPRSAPPPAVEEEESDPSVRPAPELAEEEPPVRAPRARRGRTPAKGPSRRRPTWHDVSATQPPNPTEPPSDTVASGGEPRGKASPEVTRTAAEGVAPAEVARSSSPGAGRTAR